MSRKLVAILAADVVGYAKMMGEDEAGTVLAMTTLRSTVFGQIFAENQCEVVKSMGDGWLVEFASANAAVEAAMKVQDRLTGRHTLQLRIGLHIGEVTRSGAELYGDGINIAARLEALAPPGGVLISDAVYAGLDGTLRPSFEAAGTKALKNISRKITAWLRAPAGSQTRAIAATEHAQNSLPHLLIQPVSTNDSRPDVTDLAFALTADLGTYFDGANWLLVNQDQQGCNAYQLLPTLRTQGDRLRLETRLQGPEGATLWTHKSNSSLADTSDWQDSVVEEIARTGTDMIFEAETLRIARTPDKDLTPEQCLLMGMMAWRTFDQEAFIRAATFHARAIAARPDMAEAYAEAIIVICAAHTMGASPKLTEFANQLPQWVDAARPLAPGHAMLTLAIGIATYLQDQRVAPLNQCIEQVLRLAPFDARVLSFCGWARLWAGMTEEAFDLLAKSIQVGQINPFLVASYSGIAVACVQLGRPEDALHNVSEGLKRSDTYPTPYSAKAAALAMCGKKKEARQVMQHFLTLSPNRNLKTWRATNPYGGSEGGERYFEAMRMAGPPEA